MKELTPISYKFTAKERDDETGLYYYGARYLDPKYSMWISTDPALGEYIPKAPTDDEAKKYNQNLPGMGGVYNHINFHLYHYAGNNPVRYVDPDGREIWDEDGSSCTVTKDDALWKITEKFNEKNNSNISYEEVAKVNGIKDPNLIFTNQKLDFSSFKNTEKKNNSSNKDGLIEKNQTESTWKSWASKDTGALLTKEEAELQRNIGIGEMIVGPIAGTGLSYFGPEAFTLGMYVMADGAIVITEAEKNRKYTPFASLPSFILPYASSKDGKYTFYTGF